MSRRKEMALLAVGIVTLKSPGLSPCLTSPPWTCMGAGKAAWTARLTPSKMLLKLISDTEHLPQKRLQLFLNERRGQRPQVLL